jgi:hypothetical protein
MINGININLQSRILHNKLIAKQEGEKGRKIPGKIDISDVSTSETIFVFVLMILLGDAGLCLLSIISLSLT